MYNATNYEFHRLRKELYDLYRNDINYVSKSLQSSWEQEDEELKLVKEDIKCPKDQKYKQIDLELSNLEPEEISDVLEYEFFNPNALKAVSCILKSIKNSSNNSIFQENEVMRRYTDNVKRIGEKSAFGVVMSEDLTKDHHKFSHNFSVIKVPSSKSKETELIHEAFVGKNFMNILRDVCVNFIYTFGTFYCNPPYIGNKTPKALSFCSNNNDLILHLMTENVNPSMSFSNFVKTCTAKEFIMYYLQTILATECANDMIGYWHGDLHDKNVLLRDVECKSFYLKFERSLSDKEKNNVYIKSEGKISTIIDFGSVRITGGSHLKLPPGKTYSQVGIYNRDNKINQNLIDYVATNSRYSNIPNINFPLHDAYKLLMFSFNNLLRFERFEVFDELLPLLGFFLDNELIIKIKSGEILPEMFVYDEYDDPLDGYFSLPPVDDFLGVEPFKEYVEHCLKFADKYDIIKFEIDDNDVLLKCSDNEYLEDSYDNIIEEMGVDPYNNIPDPHSLYDLVVAYENITSIYKNSTSVTNIMKNLLNNFDLEKGKSLETEYLKIPSLFNIVMFPNSIKPLNKEINLIMNNADDIAEFLNKYNILETQEKILLKVQDMYMKFLNRDLIAEKMLANEYISEDLEKFRNKIEMVVKNNIKILDSLDKKNLNEFFNTKYVALYQLIKK